MKKNIHPESHKMKFVLNDGTEFETKSCAGKEGDTVKLDIDPTNHPAWRTDSSTYVNANNDQVSKFKKKYGNVFNV